MSNAATQGLRLSNPRGARGFRVVSNDRNACPQHDGIFPVAADAAAYAAVRNAERDAHAPGSIGVKVVPYTNRRAY